MVELLNGRASGVDHNHTAPHVTPSCHSLRHCTRRHCMQTLSIGVRVPKSRTLTLTAGAACAGPLGELPPSFGQAHTPNPRTLTLTLIPTLTIMISMYYVFIINNNNSLPNMTLTLAPIAVMAPCELRPSQGKLSRRSGLGLGLPGVWGLGFRAS